MEGRRRELEVAVEELQQVRDELETELIHLRAELEAETTRSTALEDSKDEVYTLSM